MNDFEEELQKLSRMLFENEIVKTYFKVKNEIAHNEELLLLQKQITSCAQKMTLHLDDDKIYFASKEKYETLLAKYNAHPLVSNLQTLSKEVESMLLELKNIIE